MLFWQATGMIIEFIGVVLTLWTVITYTKKAVTWDFLEDGFVNDLLEARKYALRGLTFISVGFFIQFCTLFYI